jgi:hypothetical protein
MPELSTIAPKKWSANYGGVAPTVDSSNGILVGDFAIDTSTSPFTVWLCKNNAVGASVWTTVLEGNHAHDGTAGVKLAQANTHETPDTDSATTALHHTIGTGANNAAAGNHTHSGVYEPASATIINATTQIALPSADLTATGLRSSETVGESVAFGNMLYLKSDGKWWKSDADAATTMPALRMALATASADASCVMLSIGWARNDAWNWTTGGLLYASTTPGDMTQTAPSGTGDQQQVVGIAYPGDIVWFNPSLVLGEVK